MLGRENLGRDRERGGILAVDLAPIIVSRPFEDIAYRFRFPTIQTGDRLVEVLGAVERGRMPARVDSDHVPRVVDRLRREEPRWPGPKNRNR
jgi:hypothetical protein